MKKWIMLLAVLCAVSYAGARAEMPKLEFLVPVDSQSDEESLSQEVPQPVPEGSDAQETAPTETPRTEMNLFDLQVPPAQEDAPAQPVQQTTIRLDPIARGDKGGKVINLQKILIELGYLSGKADGDFGKKTETAVIQAQQSAGMNATGVADSEFLTELYSGRVPHSNGSMVQLAPRVVDYGETGHHTEQGRHYSVGNVFDGNTATCWAEGASGDGIGEGITFTVATFGRSSLTLNVWPGYHKSSTRYHQNGRPREVTLMVDGVPRSITFTDVMNPQKVVVSDVAGKAFVEFGLFIDSVYKGSRWQDTCISEIEIN